MDFKERKKERYKAAGKFVEWMKKIQKETKVVLRKAQELLYKWRKKRYEKEREKR